MSSYVKLAISLVLPSLLFFSCVKDPGENSATKKEVAQIDSVSQNPIRYLSALSVSCENPSKVLLTFLSVLGKDQYEISPYLRSDSLRFISNAVNDKVDIISFSAQDIFQVDAVSKAKLSGMKDGKAYYPSFRVAEICFESDSLAKVMLTHLEEVIYNRGDMNDKRYDYLLRHGSKLIYVSTAAKLFESYALAYKDVLSITIASYYD